MADVEPDSRPRVSDKDFMEHWRFTHPPHRWARSRYLGAKSDWQCVNCGEWCTEKARPWCELHG